MLVIVKSKREDELRVDPTSSATPAHQGRNKKRKKNFKNISTCSLVVGCFLICSIPGISYATWSYISNSLKDDRQGILFNMWGAYLSV